MKKKFQLGNCFKFIKLKCDYVWRMFFGCGTCSWQVANSVPVYNCKTVFWENISRQKHDSMGLRVLSLKIKSLFILIKTDQCLDMLLVSWFDLRVMLSHSHNESYTRDVNKINIVTVLTLSKTRSNKRKGLNFGLRGEAKKRTYAHTHACTHMREILLTTM